MPKKDFRYIPLEQKDGIFYYTIDDSEKKYILGFATPEKLKYISEFSKMNLQNRSMPYLNLPRLVILKDLTTASIKKVLDELTKTGELEKILKG